MRATEREKIFCIFGGANAPAMIASCSVCECEVAVCVLLHDFGESLTLPGAGLAAKFLRCRSSESSCKRVRSQQPGTLSVASQLLVAGHRDCATFAGWMWEISVHATR